MKNKKSKHLKENSISKKNKKQKYEQLKNKYRNPILHGGKSIFEIEPDINEIKKVDTYLRKTIMDYCLKIHSLSISTWEELDNAYRVQQNFLKL